jgi:putative intracellular protease/amidase
LRHVVVDGQPLVKGKRVTGFSDSEEDAVGLTGVVPFSVEGELKRLGGRYEKRADWASFAIADQGLITGQNPASSRAVAEALVAAQGTASISGRTAVFSGSTAPIQLA